MVKNNPMKRVDREFSRIIEDMARELGITSVEATRIIALDIKVKKFKQIRR